MRKAFLALLVCALSVVALVGTSWAACPEEPLDPGECDSLNVVCIDCVKQEGESGPWSIRFPLLVTHDQTSPADSLSGFAIPLAYTHTNPSAYCSVTTYWNDPIMISVVPNFSRSVYRDMFETDYPDTSGILYRNRMGWLNHDFVSGWDFTVLDLDGISHFWFTVVPTGTADQRWWEGDRTLLATMTMRVSDTMHICMDSTFWPPATNISFAKSDASTFVPRDNMPICFFVGPPLPGDFEIAASPDSQDVTAGNSVTYDVTLTSLNGFSSEVELSASGLPTDATVSFAPDTVVPTGASVMTINTAVTTPAGPSTITVTGTELTKVQHSTQVILNVVLPQSVEVTSPNGGEKWCVGSAHDITWTSTALDSVKIEYSTDGGSGWITVVDQYQASAGSYPWTVPSTPSANSLVRICDSRDSDPCDQSNAAFTIDDVPTAPSGCVASDDLCDKVQFCWTDNSNNETKFYIYRDAALLDSVGADVGCYDDVNASPGTTYEYCVSAYNDCGESGQCCENGTRKATPDAPTACTASESLCDMVQFFWQDNADNETGFYIYRDDTKIDSVGSNVSSYIDYGATPGITYEYCVSAYNECGESNQCCDDGARLAPPTSPTDCLASDDLCDKVQFTWTDNSDNETKFYIYRDAALFDSVDADIETYDDPTASPGVTYRYCVAALNECGVSDSCCDDGSRQTPPAAPTDCAATDNLCDKVQFTWTDNSDNEAGFYIFRDGVEFDTLAADVESYDDLTASPGATYRYCVSAFNACGVSDSCCDDGTRQAPPDAPTACAATDDLCDKVQITWTDNSDDEEGFYIRREGTKIDSVAADVESYDDLTATPGTTYEYCVSAYKACGESGQSCDDGTRKAIPDAPTDCAASSDLCGSVHFCWSDNSDNETKFYIYRDAALLDSVDADINCYDDLSGTPGTEYEYCVTAVNECGESGECCDYGTALAEMVTVTAPNGGQTWSVGSSHNITWTSQCLDNVKIEYSTNNGSNWTVEIASTAAGPGTYSWTIPNEPSDECLVRVSDADDGSPNDVSNAVFSIVAEDFSLLVSPDTLRVMRTVVDDTFFTVKLTSINGFSEPCTLKVSGLPGTATADFDPATVTPTDSATLTPFADDSVPEGYYDLVVTATEMSGAKLIEHEDTVTLWLVLPTWGFDLEASPDSQDVVVGASAQYEITMVPDVGFSAPCTLSVDAGLPLGATAEFSDTVILPDEHSTLTITTSGGTPEGPHYITVRGVANPKQDQVVSFVMAVLLVQDYSFAADPDSVHVTQGQAATYNLEFESLSGFSDPCTLMVSGLPTVDSAVFDPWKLPQPSGSSLLSIYTNDLTPVGRYVFTVTAQSQPGGKTAPVVEHTLDLILSVEEASDVDDWTDDFSRPQEFALFQNQPNPFNPETRISYFLSVGSPVNISIYNVLGQKVRTLFDGYQEAGTHSLSWDGRSDDGMQLPSGIYFYRMQAGTFQETKKMTLMK